ncbi:MAG TPA: hypothetical protein VF211_05730 [Burkholderiales bacterium]
MSGPGHDAKRAAPAQEDPFYLLAERIYVGLAARVYGTLAGTDQRKPDPKALAAYSFKLAEAFEQAYRETPRIKEALEAASRAAVKLDEVDLSGVLQTIAKKP